MFDVTRVKEFITVASSADLAEIRAALDNEDTARRLMAQMRSEWVNTWFLKYLSHPNATARVIGTTTVVALYSRASGVQIATARCMPGDTYNDVTGIAVAYAKLCNESIPDYI